MTQKLAAIALALLINCAALACFHMAGPATGVDGMHAQRAQVHVLPAVTVRPTPAQIDMLRHAPVPANADRPTAPASVG